MADSDSDDAPLKSKSATPKATTPKSPTSKPVPPPKKVKSEVKNEDNDDKPLVAKKAGKSPKAAIKAEDSDEEPLVATGKRSPKAAANKKNTPSPKTSKAAGKVKGGVKKDAGKGKGKATKDKAKAKTKAKGKTSSKGQRQPPPPLLPFCVLWFQVRVFFLMRFQTSPSLKKWRRLSTCSSGGRSFRRCPTAINGGISSTMAACSRPNTPATAKRCCTRDSPSLSHLSKRKLLQCTQRSSPSVFM